MKIKRFISFALVVALFMPACQQTDADYKPKNAQSFPITHLTHHQNNEQTNEHALDECAQALRFTTMKPEERCAIASHSNGKPCTYKNNRCVPASECKGLSNIHCKLDAITGKMCSYDSSLDECYEAFSCETLTDLKECVQKRPFAQSALCRVMPVNGVERCVSYPSHPIYLKSVWLKPVSGPQALIVKAIYVIDDGSQNQSKAYFFTFGDRKNDRFSIPADVDVVSGISHSFACGLTKEGLARCWGNETNALKNPPPFKFADIKVAERYACGLVKKGEPHAQHIACWGAVPQSITNNSSAGFVSLPIGATTESSFSDFAVADDQLCAIGTTEERYYFNDVMTRFRPFLARDFVLPFLGNMKGYISCSHKTQFDLSAPFYPKVDRIVSSQNSFCGFLNLFTYQGERAFCWLSKSDAVSNMHTGRHFFDRTGFAGFSTTPYVTAGMNTTFSCFLKRETVGGIGHLECLDDQGNTNSAFAPPLALGEIRSEQFTVAEGFACAVKDGAISCFGPESANILSQIPTYLKK